MKRAALVVLVVFCLSSAAEEIHAEVLYTVMDLGTLGGTQSNAAAINDSGQVTGFSFTPDNFLTRAFCTAPNKPINPLTDNLGPTGGLYSEGRGINNNGRVVGDAALLQGVTRGFSSAPNSLINPYTDDLGPLLPANHAYAINNHGQVVGTATMATGADRAFRTAPNAQIDPLTDDLGQQNAVAYGINDSGQVVGKVGEHAFRTAANSKINMQTDDLGTLGGTNSVARGINNLGQTVGWSDVAGDRYHRAFRTSADGKIDPLTDNLGSLGGKNSEAWAINEKGQVVGWSEVGDVPHAFLYDDSGMHDLNSLISPNSGWVLSYANDINNSGQIVGIGRSPNGNYHGFVLTPVPEPSTFVLLASLGLPAVFLLRKQWRRS